MESYNRWRKMLFDVLSEKEFLYLFHNGEEIASSDTVEIPKQYAGNQYMYGICSCNTNSFNKYNKEAFNMGIFSAGIPSTTFRTVDIYRNKDLRNELLIAHVSTNSINISWEEELVITAEGLLVIHGDKKKKLLFLDDGYDYKITFSTFHELATNGFKLSGNRLSLTPKVSKNYVSSVYVTDTMKIYSVNNYLRAMLPKLVELVKENEDLYEDAIDEICEKYPQEEK